MKFNKLILGILLIGISNLYGQSLINIKFGNSNIKFDYIDNKCDTLIFVNLHNNEQTSITAIKQVLLKSPGIYYGLQSGKKRELTIDLNGKSISFDPNRIFTKTGIKKTLKNYNCFSESNAKLVNAFAQEILSHISKAKLLVAVHNNTGVGYSITSILNSNTSKHEVKEININPNKDENDFYFVTQKSKFDYFKSKGYNVVLQDNKKVEDDGSLSVYCGKKNMDYINIECENGHLKEQIEMIKEIYIGFFVKAK